MAAVTNFDIYSEHAQFRRPLAWSFGLHVAFAVFVVLAFWRGFTTHPAIHWAQAGSESALSTAVLVALTVVLAVRS